MKHTEPKFWQFVTAYVLIGAGTLLLIGEVVEFGLMEKRPALLTAIAAIWFGVLTLTVVKKSAPNDDR